MKKTIRQELVNALLQKRERESSAGTPNDELKHYGILGMKWGVRRTPEELGHKPPISREASSIKDAVDQALAVAPDPKKTMVAYEAARRGKTLDTVRDLDQAFIDPKTGKTAKPTKIKVTVSDEEIRKAVLDLSYDPDDDTAELTKKFAKMRDDANNVLNREMREGRRCAFQMKGPDLKQGIKNQEVFGYLDWEKGATEPVLVIPNRKRDTQFEIIPRSSGNRFDYSVIFEPKTDVNMDFSTSTEVSILRVDDKKMR